MNTETENTREDITIRRLKVRDLETITKIFDNYIKEFSDEAMTKIITSEKTAAEEGTTEEEIGKTLISLGSLFLSKIVSVFNVEITELFADLLDVSIEEYKELDMDTPIRVIEKIKEAPEVAGFFMMSSLLSKGTTMLEKPLQKIKDALNITSAEDNKNS
jgi:tellurite resistance protein